MELEPENEELLLMAIFSRESCDRCIIMFCSSRKDPSLSGQIGRQACSQAGVGRVKYPRGLGW